MSTDNSAKRERDDVHMQPTSDFKVPKRTVDNDNLACHTVLLWPRNNSGGGVQFPLDDAWLLLHNYSPYLGEEKEKLASDAIREKIQVPCTEEVLRWLLEYVAAETRAAHALPDATGPLCSHVSFGCRTIARAGIYCALVAMRHCR